MTRRLSCTSNTDTSAIVFTSGSNDGCHNHLGINFCAQEPSLSVSLTLLSNSNKYVNSLERSNEENLHEIERCGIDERIWSPDHAYCFASKKCQILCLGVVYDLLVSKKNENTYSWSQPIRVFQRLTSVYADENSEIKTFIRTTVVTMFQLELFVWASQHNKKKRKENSQVKKNQARSTAVKGLKQFMIVSKRRLLCDWRIKVRRSRKSW